MKIETILPIVEINNLTLLATIKGIKRINNGEDQTTYSTLEDWLKECDSSIILVYHYQLFAGWLEQWGLAKGLYIPPMTANLKYTGDPHKDYLSLIHKVSENVVRALDNTKEEEEGNNTPTTISIKLKWQGKKYYFYNIEAFISEANNPLLLSYDTMLYHYKVLTTLTDTFIIPYWNKDGRKGIFPKTLASLARELFSLIPVSAKMGTPRAQVLANLKPSYRSGLVYVAEEAYDTLEVPIYDYDIKSMYPFLLLNRLYPNPLSQPKIEEGFIPINKHQLAHYHIKSLYATLKSNAIPCLFWNEETQTKIIKASDYRSTISTSTINLNFLPDGFPMTWITSIDYELLTTYYDIKQIEIDTTVIWDRLINGSLLFNEEMLNLVYQVKEETQDSLLKQCAKMLLNTFTGSIGMMVKNCWRISNLIGDLTSAPILVREKNKEIPAWDISSFMTAYGRQLIMQEVMKAGGANNVIAIITDGFYTKAPINLNNNGVMGSLKLDKVMTNSRWLNVNQYYWDEGCAISGLPKKLYKPGQMTYSWPVIMYDNKKLNYYQVEKKFNLIPKEEEEENEE